MKYGILVRTILFFLVTTYFTLAVQNSNGEEKEDHDKINQENHQIITRTRRAIKKPGFFRTLFSVIYEQWNDTKNTFGTINNLINDNFLPDNAPVTEATTPSDPNASTTAAPYKISRKEFNRIVQRNLKGLQRLYNIELQDALQQSKKYDAEFKRNASLEVSKFL
ncbi:uncharacterized protein LOC108903650 isoform X1 [Anoplophora glabripennis]|uniref:uncharacterized protein LOC108903650 isoform X2 n=1 Tax=Anoplophora glabripennis TaxID=217634 RepID=UPI0008745897|nr:uncharacterized protein LOC108903650 isoform X2 [Anoplophora glabripennis]XP_023311196.1 uncharacterized protein LOC108903650 isoform X1 [Anoplophora glabripennis]XP_023311200.1 uncharacterized protein LOC108903650 isoform X1 [Anoplophora glabripennis]